MDSKTSVKKKVIKAFVYMLFFGVGIVNAQYLNYSYNKAISIFIIIVPVLIYDIYARLLKGKNLVK